MHGLLVGQHKAQVKDYPESNRRVLKCSVCGIEVGFDPDKRSGLDRTKLLFEKLPCVSSNALGSIRTSEDRADSSPDFIPESGLMHVASQFGLSPRESQVLRLILRGLASKEIASEMKLSPNTVKAFIRMLMIKMAVSTRARIVVKALNCVKASQESTVRLPDEPPLVQAASSISTAHTPSMSERPGSSPPVQVGNNDAAPLGRMTSLISDFCAPEVAGTEAIGEESSGDTARVCVAISSETPCCSEECWSDRFTPKEIKILGLLVQGSTCEEIATQLDASEKTVRNYLRALASTTGAADLSELAEFTVAHRVLEPAAKGY